MKRFLILTIVLPLCLGCGSDSQPKLVPVSGTVTWNGAPLPDGDIIFNPTESGKVPESGKIVDGRFDFDARPGNNLVEIRASRPGKYDPVMGSAGLVPYIPAKYNRATTLKADVVPNGDNQFKFDLREDRK